MNSPQSNPQKLPHQSIQRILGTVNRAVSTVTGMLADPDKTGGYFCLLDIETGAILVTIRIGSVNPEKSAKYKNFAEEKALRLHAHHFAHATHVSSFQSADEQTKRYGGSVLGDRFIYSFSGFPPIYDEAIALATAHKHRDMPKERRTQITQFSSPHGEHPSSELIASLAIGNWS